jgi:hypothetical protein
VVAETAFVLHAELRYDCDGRCGYRYPEKATDCPPLATVRPVLYRRRGEDAAAVNRLSAIRFADLHSQEAARSNRAAARAAVSSGYGPAALLDLPGSRAGSG